MFGIERFQILVGLDRAGLGRRNAEFFEAVAGGVGDPADGAQQLVEGDANVLAVVFGDQDLLAVLDHELLGRVADQHGDALLAEALRHQSRKPRDPRGS